MHDGPSKAGPITLAVAHDLLTQENWESASTSGKSPKTPCRRGAQTQSRILAPMGPHIQLPPKQALGIAMALHESRTNAVKYGSLSNATGRISLDWSVTDDPQPRLKLDWRESGGPPVSPPKRRGFGTVLLQQSLGRDLNGEVCPELQSGRISPAPSKRRCQGVNTVAGDSEFWQRHSADGGVC